MVLRNISIDAKYRSWRWVAVRYFLFLAVLPFLIACSGHHPKYIIGVSQCSEDIWRDKLNNELKIGTYFHDGVELRFASADDSDEKQIEQIRQFVDDGIDLLIVAPNQVATVSPAIDEVYDKGIPVIVFDRKTNSEKFTAYIGADNFEMGRLMGEYIATRLKGKGRVLEIMGLKGSSPAIERHNGFVRALKAYPAITLVASLQGDWTEESAVNMKTLTAPSDSVNPETTGELHGNDDIRVLLNTEIPGNPSGTPRYFYSACMAAERL